MYVIHPGELTLESMGEWQKKWLQESNNILASNTIQEAEYKVLPGEAILRSVGVAGQLSRDASEAPPGSDLVTRSDADDLDRSFWNTEWIAVKAVFCAVSASC